MCTGLDDSTEQHINTALAETELLLLYILILSIYQSVNDMLGGVGGSSSIEAFERMHQKVTTTTLIIFLIVMILLSLPIICCPERAALQ